MRLVLALLLAALPFSLPLAVGDSCIPSCEVVSHTFFFAPAIIEVDSGSTVTWSALDVVHTATDRADFCFDTHFNVGAPGSAYFAISEGALFSISDLGFAECAGATALPDGSFLQDYECLLHPNMEGKLLVR